MFNRQHLEGLHDQTGQLLAQISREIENNIRVPTLPLKTATRTTGWGISALILLALLYHWKTVTECVRREGSFLGVVLACLSAYPALQAEQSLVPASSVQTLGDLQPTILEQVNVVLKELHRLNILSEISIRTPIARVMHLMEHALNVMTNMLEKMPSYATGQHARLFNISQHFLANDIPQQQRISRL